MQATRPQLTFTLATSHKSRSLILPSKRDLGLTMLMGHCSFLSVPIHANLIFNRKSQVTDETLSISLGRKEAFCESWQCPLPFLQLREQS